MNFYNISQQPDRLQTAQHFHSSLEQPTLANVQSQLYVTRQRNYELAAQYFENKYGNSQLYDSYVQAHQLEGLGPPKPQTYDLKVELQKQALKIQAQETQKYKTQKQKQKQKTEGDQQYLSSQYKAPRTSKPRNNIWAPQSKSDPKPQPIEQSKIKQGIVIMVQQAKEGAFMSEFKNYLSNKKKIKEEQSPSKMTATVVSQFKDTQQLQAKKYQKNYEQQLVKKIFRDIKGKSHKNQYVEKVTLVQYLNQNPKILKVLGCTAQQASLKIINQQCKIPQQLSLKQTLMFVYNVIGKIQQMKKLRAEEEFQSVPQGCMISKNLMQLFEDTFKQLDRHSDLIVKRIAFIGRLTSDPTVKQNLNMPAVYQPQYQRHVSLRRIFQRIEIQTLLASEEEKKTRQYISWSEFMQYFQSGHNERNKYDLIVLLQSLKNQQKFGLAHLPDGVSSIISEGIREADTGAQLINTLQIINAIKLHPEYEVQKYSFIGRNQGPLNNQETLEDALSRIKSRSLRFVTPKQFMEYFSTRGRPVDQEPQKQKDKQSKNKYSAVKVSNIEKQMFDQPPQPEGYDSDPELYNGSKLMSKPNQFRKSQKQFKKVNNTSLIQQDVSQDYYDTQNIKITVPQPFSFEERQKQRQKRKQMESEQAAPVSSIGFRAKPVPKNVSTVGLYHRMVSQQKNKNQERKRCSMIMTLANEQPFSFQQRKINKKTKEQRQKFVFQAKPIPWYCSVQLLNRKKQEEIIRNQKIAKEAQQNLAKARLPPRMQKDFLQKQAKKAQQQAQRVKPQTAHSKVKEPPNFDKLHKDFQEGMQRKRKQQKTTQIQQFRWTSTSKIANSSKIQQQQIQNMSNIPKARQIPASSKTQVDIFASSTAKFTQQVQKRRKQMDQKRQKEEKKMKQQQQRKKIDEGLKKKLHSVIKGSKEQDEDIKTKAQKENNRQLEVFKSWKQQRIAKGRQQPLLVQRGCKRDQQMQKMKRLYEISKTLKNNKITGKQHDHYFKRQELLLLQDYEDYLKKTGEKP